MAESNLSLKLNIFKLYNDVLTRMLLKVILLYHRQDSKMQELHSANNRTNGRWTKEEHLKFLEGLRVYGKNWKKIEQLVATRTGSQIRSHAQKFFLKSLHTANKDQNDIQVASDEMIEQLQEVTLNSKTISESGFRENQFSFYLQKIVKHCTDKQNLDFWSSLVDSKGKVSTPNHNTHSYSFTNFEKSPRERELSKPNHVGLPI